VGEGHRSSPSEPLYPIIGFDYFFITKDSKVLTKNEAADLGEDEAVKCLVIRDRMTKCVFAVVVPQKGVDQDRWVVQQIVQVVEWLGHAKVLLKSDQEKAILAVVREALKDLKVLDISASDEESVRYDSQSNGATEVGVRLIRGPFRTHRLDLERRLGWQIPVSHPVVHWLLRHVCTLHNALKVGDDGYTPWIRARGRPFNQQLCCFGEQIGYKFPGKGPQANPRGNMGPMWGSGTWLGINVMSGEHIVATQEGVVYARGFTRRPCEEQWSVEAVAELKATPHSLREPRQRGAAFEHPTEKHPTLEDRAPGLPRSFKITKMDVQMHGYTDNCPQCDHIRSYGEPRPGQTHTPTCRARIMHEIGQSVQGQARLAAAQERTDRALADHVERHDPERQGRDVDPGPTQEHGAARPRTASDVFDRPDLHPQLQPDDMDDGDQPAADDQGDQHMPADTGMDVDAIELMPGHVGRKTAKCLGLDFRQPLLNTTRTTASTHRPSTVSRSTEGWLPLADDGSRAETSCAAAREVDSGAGT